MLATSFLAPSTSSKHFPRKRKKLVFDSILRANYALDASSLDVT
jgi:hypothetical protein